MSPDAPKEGENTAAVSYEVAWKSKASEGGLTEVPRRTFPAAMELALQQRNAGYEVKLFRVEKTELDF